MLVACCALILGSLFATQSFRSSTATAAVPVDNSWYFAVSGDSRDCGDLIMPKIAKAIVDNSNEAPVQFYWHLGDLRALYRFDCDWGMAHITGFQCPPAAFSTTTTVPHQTEYYEDAWTDFTKNEIGPFKVPFILGIGNHELYGPKTREKFINYFEKQLRQKMILDQWSLDRDKPHDKINSPLGSTYYHFIKNGVDFINLDNSDPGDATSRNPNPTKGFSTEQLKWLDQVLHADESEPSVKTIIVGMHAALPFSISRDHAMDNTCSSFCSGNQAYNRLDQVRAAGKHVYVLASHSHYFEQDIYNTWEHKDDVLPGFIVGTAGAEQYKPGIRYGYLLVKIKPDGTIRTTFEEVGRESPPVGDNAQLVDYCFKQNRRAQPSEPAVTAVPLIKDSTYCKCQ